jgi:hypothetical protein
MRIPSGHPLDFTYTLLNPEFAARAAEALRGRSDREVIEGLSELLAKAPPARTAAAAIASLEGLDDPVIRDALCRATASPHASVRTLAVQALHRRRAADADDAMERVLRTDSSWTARRAALVALADRPEPVCCTILAAADDPHWRVRHALIQVLMSWGETDERRRRIDGRLGNSPREQGLRDYLAYRRTGVVADAVPADEAADPLWRCPWWDWDAAVLARNLERMGEAGRRDAIDAMAALLGHADERVRRIAVETLRQWGEPRHLAEALALLGEPRSGAGESVANLIGTFDIDRAEVVARYILSLPAPSSAPLAWARSQLGAVEALHPSPAASRAENPDPFARAAALTPERAAELVAAPQQETSWHVLTRAARIAKVPLWELAPEHPWRPAESVVEPPPPLTPRLVVSPNARPLGPERLQVSRIGVSGHYGLPVEGFIRAVEAGVNLLFWEPNYATLTEFAGRLAAPDRHALHFIAGTFEADGPRVRRDAERALRTLRLERLSLFLMFWVQSWHRITDDVYTELERLKAAGKVAMFGLSTHSRPLAVEAIEAGWDPVMVRHSAAHRGAETHVLPAAAARGTSILTFNNTCYGRLLRPGPEGPPRPSDCFRYTLAEPAVTACLTAPATVEYLEENLTALDDPVLPEDRRRRLVGHGEAVYREDTVFRRLVRSR